MEYIEGETLREHDPPPRAHHRKRFFAAFKQALLGIGYAHRAGIIHRDIKPSNLMLNKNGIVKVMDFGIAKVLGARGMTRTGTQMGTVAYMSPEQIQNRTVDIRSDIYALGVTLYEMLSGHLPFESDSDFKVMQDQVATPPPLPTRYYPVHSQGPGKRGAEGAGERSQRAISNRRGIWRRHRTHPDTVATVAHVPPPIPSDSATAHRAVALARNCPGSSQHHSRLPRPRHFRHVSMPLGAAVQLPQPVPESAKPSGARTRS